ncbi:MAG TPA: LytTR family DNA-binding domain-containing protein [Casimicrobiaceae bacterium]|nr:LytTR family DNA-binding domain-containing protein [Casimicrobiaceae bacterium]
MSAPTAILAEDEELLRGELREMLAAQWPELAVVAEAADGQAAMRAVDECAPAILFLDIEMPGVSGLEVARRASGRCHVVFVTAYDKYAVAAFEQGAVDYVMKPFSAARLDATIARLKQRLAGPPADLTGLLKSLASTLAQRKDYLRWITAAQGDSLRLITVDEICYFRADHKYTLVVTPDTEALIRRPLKALAEEVDPQAFWQIHRSAMVNVKEIAGVNRDFRGHLTVRLKQRKETLPVGENYVHLFKQM